MLTNYCTSMLFCGLKARYILAQGNALGRMKPHKFALKGQHNKIEF